MSNKLVGGKAEERVGTKGVNDLEGRNGLFEERMVAVMELPVRTLPVRTFNGYLGIGRGVMVGGYYFRYEGRNDDNTVSMSVFSPCGEILAQKECQIGKELGIDCEDRIRITPCSAGYMAAFVGIKVNDY
jgi:hypothetical protein